MRRNLIRALEYTVTSDFPKYIVFKMQANIAIWVHVTQDVEHDVDHKIEKVLWGIFYTF